MKIGIDWDNTTFDTVKTIHNIYNYENCTHEKIPKRLEYEWNFKGLVSEDYIPRCYQLFSSDLLIDKRFMCFEEDAINVINRLSEKHEIYFITNQPKDRRENTMKLINEFFPKCSARFCNSFDKSEKSIGLDIFIDDKIECLESVRDIVKQTICYSIYNWNIDKNIDLRINNWIEIEKFIESFAINYRF